eukprot:986377-Amphidinium_carterae.1
MCSITDHSKPSEMQASLFRPRLSFSSFFFLHKRTVTWDQGHMRLFFATVKAVPSMQSEPSTPTTFSTAATTSPPREPMRSTKGAENH